MNVTIEPTAEIDTLTINGQPIPVRIWKGKTSGGVEIEALVLSIIPEDKADSERMQAELPPSAAIYTAPAVAMWRTDMSAAPRDEEVWLFSPAQALGPHEKDDVRLARPRDWGWATMWMPAYIPAPPPVADEGTKS